MICIHFATNKIRDNEIRKKAGFGVTSAWYRPGNATIDGSRQRPEKECEENTK